MRRTTRFAAAGAVAVAAFSLAACDQPAPKLTIQTGSVSMQVSPTSYSFDSSHTRTYRRSLPTISADLDGRVLVDVPRKLAKAGWSVTGISLTGKGASLGTTDINDKHTFRVAANTNNGNPFIVEVNQLRDGKPDGSVWSFLIKVDSGA